MLKENAIQHLCDRLPNIQVNKYPFSSIARPTTGIRRTSIWGLRVRDNL
jgi:F-box and leucine-rich repeat protein 1 (S-phase kinase-associated protein 2)